MYVRVLRPQAEVQDERDAVVINGCVAGDDHAQLDAMQLICRDVG